MLVELATRLDRTKFAPSVCSLAGPPARSKQTLVERLANAQIPVEFLGLQSVLQYPAAVRQLELLFRAQRIELVQSFLFHANVVAARAARAAGVEHVVTGIRVADPRRWRIWVERVATAKADRFVCVSQSVAEYVRWQGFEAEKLLVVPNGVDLNRWQNASPLALKDLGIQDGRKVLLYVGRLDRQKGLDGLFTELPALFRKLPNHDLALVGSGPLESPLKRQADRQRIEKRVHFLGWREDVAAIMQSCSLLVLPSRWEGMPNVVLEAMAAGKPVVATQSEGTVELLGLGALEQTVAVGDWPGLSNRIVEIAKDDQLAARLAKQNQARAEQFSLDRVAERYQRLYLALLEKNLRPLESP